MFVSEIKAREILSEVSPSFQWEKGSGSLTDEEIWETERDKVIHDSYQGAEIQNHDRNNHVELEKTGIPAGTEGIDGSREPEQKGLKEYGKTKGL